MMSIYFLIFWIPSIASLVMLILSLSSGLLNRPIPVVALCVFALFCQSVGQLFSPLWAVGLVLQTIMAIFLAIQVKLGF